VRVDAPTAQWESHDAGDELVVLLSGATRIVLDHDESNFRTLEVPFESFVVPRGRWHRHDGAGTGTKLLYLTPQGQVL
jgi:quercetin dioxygenase-like cupin family protein